MLLQPCWLCTTSARYTPSISTGWLGDLSISHFVLTLPLISCLRASHHLLDLITMASISLRGVNISFPIFTSNTSQIELNLLALAHSRFP